MGQTLSVMRDAVAAPACVVASKRFGSTDSLSAWSPFGRDATEYALRQVTSAAGHRRPAPVLVDRRALEKAFRRLDESSQARTGGSGPFSHSLRAENVRQACEIKDLKNELKERHWLKKTAYEKQIDKEYSVLNNEFIALKEETLRILSCGIGDREIDDRVLANLNKFTPFFEKNVLYINSVESTWPIQYKTHLLEHLKKLFTQHLSRVEELINGIVAIK